MVLVHYYHLESRGLPMSRISNLRYDIDHHFLERSNLERLCAPEVAGLLDSGTVKDSLDPCIYNSGEFRILFYGSTERKQEGEKREDKRFFSSLRPNRTVVDIEVIVAAGSPADLIELQDFLLGKTKYNRLTRFRNYMNHIKGRRIRFLEARPIQKLHAHSSAVERNKSISEFVSGKYSEVKICPSYSAEGGIHIFGAPGEMLDLKDQLRVQMGIQLALNVEFRNIIIP